MRAPKSFSAIAVGVALASLVGCAAHPESRGDQRRASLECPSGYTLTCEVDRTGRLYHGSFKKNLDKCGCVNEMSRTIVSPAIPAIH